MPFVIYFVLLKNICHNTCKIRRQLVNFCQNINLVIRLCSSTRIQGVAFIYAERIFKSIVAKQDFLDQICLIHVNSMPKYCVENCQENWPISKTQVNPKNCTQNCTENCTQNCIQIEFLSPCFGDRIKILSPSPTNCPSSETQNTNIHKCRIACTKLNLYSTSNFQKVDKVWSTKKCRIKSAKFCTIQSTSRDQRVDFSNSESLHQVM